MSKYGIPYKGNKSKIAEEILTILPPGERLVDLFGGGFAITDCALRKFPNKWNRFFYNDKNELLQPLIRSAIRGEYNLETYKPEWISRERFLVEKERDGYVKWIWSFGNNGNDYLYGRDIEDDKRKVFEYIVNGKVSDVTKGIELCETEIPARRLEWQRKAQLLNREPYRLQVIERLQCLCQLEALGRLDYHDYVYQEGDVVYCDIPYADSKNNSDYGGGFDHKEFFRWANEQTFPVYYSSYSSGKVCWQKEVRSVMNSGKKSVYRMETLFII